VSEDIAHSRPLLALNGHPNCSTECPLSGGGFNRSTQHQGSKSFFDSIDPKWTADSEEGTLEPTFPYLCSNVVAYRVANHRGSAILEVL
jgi:hypothetical protein